MYKILLCCRSGLTTSKLVNSMKEEAASQNIDAIVWTVGQHALDSSCFDADCILVAPQNEFEYKKVKSVVNDIIPVSIIDCDDFTRMDGKDVLNNAVELIENTRL